jgi:hypothetical protein
VVRSVAIVRRSGAFSAPHNAQIAGISNRNWPSVSVFAIGV